MAAIVKQAEKRRALKINLVNAERRMHLKCDCRVGHNHQQRQQQQQHQRGGPSGAGSGGW